MKRVVAAFTAFFGSISGALAGPPSGFVTIRMDWTSGTSAAAESVPTLGTYGALMLAVLLALVVYRALRNRAVWARAFAPFAAFGLAASAAFMAESPVASAPVPPPIEGDSCTGSSTYTADRFTAPPCFVNNCGEAVTVSYTILDGQTAVGAPLTEDNCTLIYSCANPTDTAEDGASIPSDGVSRGTASCEEITAILDQ